MRRTYPIKHWEIIREIESPAAYSWRSIGADGLILQASGSFPTIGKAIVDAIRNGFAPGHDHWIKKDPDFTIHFYKDRDPVIIAADGHRVGVPDEPPLLKERR